MCHLTHSRLMGSLVPGCLLWSYHDLDKFSQQEEKQRVVCDKSRDISHTVVQISLHDCSFIMFFECVTTGSLYFTKWKAKHFELGVGANNQSHRVLFGCQSRIRLPANQKRKAEVICQLIESSCIWLQLIGEKHQQFS